MIQGQQDIVYKAYRQADDTYHSTDTHTANWGMRSVTAGGHPCTWNNMSENVDVTDANVINMFWILWSVGKSS